MVGASTSDARMHVLQVKPLQVAAPRGIMAGFVAGGAEGSLRVVTPKGAVKPQRASVTHDPHNLKAGHAGTPGGSSTNSLSRYAARSNQQPVSSDIPADKAKQKAGAGSGPQQGSEAHGSQAAAGVTRWGVRTDSEEVEEGELEPGEMSAGFESGEEEVRGAPQPAGPTSETLAPLPCCVSGIVIWHKAWHEACLPLSGRNAAH